MHQVHQSQGIMPVQASHVLAGLERGWVLSLLPPVLDEYGVPYTSDVPDAHRAFLEDQHILTSILVQLVASAVDDVCLACCSVPITVNAARWVRPFDLPAYPTLASHLFGRIAADLQPFTLLDDTDVLEAVQGCLGGNAHACQMTSRRVVSDPDVSAVLSYASAQVRLRYSVHPGSISTDALCMGSIDDALLDAALITAGALTQLRAELLGLPHELVSALALPVSNLWRQEP